MRDAVARALERSMHAIVAMRERLLRCATCATVVPSSSLETIDPHVYRLHMKLLLIAFLGVVPPVPLGCGSSSSCGTPPPCPFPGTFDEATCKCGPMSFPPGFRDAESADAAGAGDVVTDGQRADDAGVTWPGWSCSYGRSRVVALDSVLPGSSLTVEQIVATVVGRRRSLLTWKAPDGPDLTVHPPPGTTVLTLDIAQSPGALSYFDLPTGDVTCSDSVLSIPAHVALVTDDGALDESWDFPLTLGDPTNLDRTIVYPVSNPDVSVDLWVQRPRGTFAVTYVGQDHWDTVSVPLHALVRPLGTFGDIWFLAHGTHATGSDATEATQRSAGLASWVPMPAIGDAGVGE